mmetsp:Transcript_56432/g.111552  ORF Transcript_56432/g.111552 Transcript_56432/m.111552 type:complete len:158 (+) Transcript_56432:137-610(+)
MHGPARGGSKPASPFKSEGENHSVLLCNKHEVATCIHARRVSPPRQHLPVVLHPREQRWISSNKQVSSNSFSINVPDLRGKSLAVLLFACGSSIVVIVLSKENSGRFLWQARSRAHTNERLYFMKARAISPLHVAEVLVMVFKLTHRGLVTRIHGQT